MDLITYRWELFGWKSQSDVTTTGDQDSMITKSDENVWNMLR